MGVAGGSGGAATDVAWRRQDELRSRILFTLGALLVWRLLHFVPLPGVDTAAVAALAGVTPLPIPRMSLVALGLTPFVTAFVLAELARGRVANWKLDRFRLVLTLALAAFQAWSMAAALENVTGAVEEPGLAFRAMATLTLTAGVALAVWLGAEITRRGLGEGLWVLVAADIVSNLTSALASYASPDSLGDRHPEWVYGPIAMLVALTALIVLVELALREVPLEARDSAGDTPAPLRLRLDHATILPASLALMLPLFFALLLVATVGPVPGMDSLVEALGRTGTLQLVLLAVAVPALSLAVTRLRVQPRAIAAALQTAGTQIVGVPAAGTAAHLASITRRLSGITAAYLSVVALAPTLGQYFQLAPVALDGINLLILVLVALRIIRQVRRIAGLPLSVLSRGPDTD